MTQEQRDGLYGAACQNTRTLRGIASGTRNASKNPSGHKPVSMTRAEMMAAARSALDDAAAIERVLCEILDSTEVMNDQPTTARLAEGQAN